MAGYLSMSIPSEIIGQRAFEVAEKASQQKISEAVKNAKDLYPIVVQSFQNFNVRSQKPPYAAALILIDVIFDRKNQFETELKYTCAKVARVALDTTFIYCLLQKESVRMAVYKEVMSVLENSLKEVKSYDVNTKYELKCCYAAFDFLISEGAYVKDILVQHGPGVVKAIISCFTGKPDLSEFLPLFKQLGGDILKLFKNRWQGDVLDLQIHGKKALGYLIGEDYKTFGELFNSLIDKYKEKEKVVGFSDQIAFCLVETFSELIAAASKNQQLKSSLIYHSTDFCLTGFVHYKLTDFSQAKFWKVRYRALEHVFDLLDQKDPNWALCVKVIIEKIGTPSEERKKESVKVWNLINNRLAQFFEINAIDKDPTFMTIRQNFISQLKALKLPAKLGKKLEVIEKLKNDLKVLVDKKRQSMDASGNKSTMPATLESQIDELKIKIAEEEKNIQLDMKYDDALDVTGETINNLQQ